MKRRIVLRIPGGEACKFHRRTRAVVIDAQRGAVGIEGQDTDIGRNHRKPVFLELQLCGDLREQRTGAMQDRRTEKTPMELFGDRDATNDFTPLEYQRSETGLREIARGHQSVVARSDDDDSRSPAHHQLFHSRRIFFAALRPGAPMMPPPGCVADPHI